MNIKLTVPFKSISHEAAQFLVNDAIDAARATLGPYDVLPSDPVAVTIVGLDKETVVSAAMDGVRPIAVGLSHRKALSALATHFPTDGIAGYLASLGAPFDARDFGPDVTSFGGGIPLRLKDGTIIGAIGVSGRMIATPPGSDASFPPQDADLAGRAAAKLLELDVL